mmetsp:Transcript_66421/g.110441  ORF Transcript_66421/g.110441 Transcript_66421/m.110441 type:complete len:332 (-) Transcript_66421:550-1545(-)|eukprot:CAMPEP_0119329988 /NCGR_PEP_ID=MMETSP1333-20130426/77231_1 /TAXON_ID=418940 /ORGANISM="Scyphosphaera apsteinii, Strain RCC1455" /LENGTH=331 /DNA_ID=CAMNT_0007339255 /DNA_START=19 /DNA_END=1014 /DNA_ORIENTATION=+
MSAWLLLLTTIAVCGCCDLLYRLFSRRHTFRGLHVLVTGGSSGIGKALATQLLTRGARITLLARTETKLIKAVKELQAGRVGQSVRYECADIADSDALHAAVARATSEFGPIDSLICNAGSATPGLFLELPIKTFEQQMDVNYLGTLRTIKAVVPQMVDRQRGQVIIVASALAVVSFIGYSAYAPTKHALRGLADTLRNELIGFGISVHIAYPPDTETPGYAHENETKPPETAAVVPADVYTADSVAKAILCGAEAGRYHLPSPDVLQNWMISGAAGITPRGWPMLESLFLTPLVALIEAAVLMRFDYFGRKYAARAATEKVAATSALRAY